MMMSGLTEKLSLTLLALLALLWVGAKAHFFTRFGATTVEEYLLEHGPFWATMGLVAALLYVVGAVARRKEN